MRWFEGTMNEAVAKSKTINGVFVVFVEGADEMSRELAATLDAAEVSSTLEDTSRFLSVKLSSTSPNYAHFAQIYKFVPVPSVFFIGPGGAPLEVVCAGITADRLRERIDNIMAQHFKSNVSPPGAVGTSAASSSQALIQAESQSQAKLVQSEAQSQAKPVQTEAQSQAKPIQAHAEIVIDKAEEKPDKTDDEGPTAAKQARPSPEYETVCDGDVCVRRVKTAPSEGTSTEQMVTEAGPAEQPSIDSRLERAKELLEAKRREKIEKEKELEKQKEMERRAMGQGVAELKRWQAEQELKEAAEERRREKLEEARARQRVLDQIAQDRAERRARETPAASPVTPAASAPPPPSESPSVNTTRIQLKLPDGSSHVVTLSADDSIADVHRYITEHHLVQSNAPFTLWTSFPRRELPASPATLRESGLAPSAALLVLSAGSGVAAGLPAMPALPAPVAGFYAMITSLLTSLVLQPVQSVWAWLSARLFPPAAGGARPRPPSPPAAGGAAGLRYRPAAANIHRLREDRSSDDENNTWNGNSTQQM